MHSENPWKILVVDDDREVHAVSAMVLRDVGFLDRPLRLLSAYSAAEALDIMRSEEDVALILLDVVMETEHAGLALVRTIRRELGNRYVRIMLRTGQAGHAPEESVILEYDINDYREKTELDARKLLTSVIAALRSYNDLMTIRAMNEELEAKVTARTAELEEANRRLLEDHKAGGMMQYRLLPRRSQRFASTRFSRYLLPSMYLSGDFVDYFALREGSVGFYLADVSGHGTSSAFVTVILKNLIDNRIEQYLAGGDDLVLHPARLMERLNRELLRDDLGKYITILYGILDTASGEIRFANCGHNPLPLLRTGDGEVSYWGQPDRPLGMFADFSTDEQELTLADGDSLLLVSDGILEMLGGTSIRECKERLRHSLEGDEVSIRGLIEQFELEETEELPDDVTFLMIQRESEDE